MHWKLLPLLSLVAASAISAPASSHWAQEGTMTKAEILNRIIGNTMTGSTTDGTTYTEYYAPDGTIRGTEPTNGAYEGRWSVRDDDVMCWAYAPDYAIIGCVLLILKGDTVNFRLIDGHTEPPAKLLPGNPAGL